MFIALALHSPKKKREREKKKQELKAHDIQFQKIKKNLLHFEFLYFMGECLCEWILEEKRNNKRVA